MSHTRHHVYARQRSRSWTEWPEDGRPFHPDVIESKDVLVIGNGPSAITLSFLLSGRWPYYDPSNAHPIDYLHERLTHTTDPSRSLLEADLDQLSQGLTGRSLNRVSLLFDQLQNPNTDFGHRQPSTLSWKYHPEKAIDHVVLGTGLPGGLWYALRKSKTVLTVSRQKWMTLPEMAIPATEESADSCRISFDSIAAYYRSYVEHFNLGKYFINHTRVTRVEWCPDLDCWIVDALTKKCVPPASNGASKHSPLSQSHCNSHSFLKHLKCVGKGRSTSTTPTVKYLRTRFLAKSVVLATGANSASPSLLNVPGEASSFVLHSLDQLDSILKSSKIPMPRPDLASLHSGPIVLIIGSGLSSADALNMLAPTPFRAVHIFRRSIGDRNLIFNQLSNENLYPEYSQVFRRMKASIKAPLCVPCFLRSGAPYQAYHRAALRAISPGPSRATTVDFLNCTEEEPSVDDQCSHCSQPLWHQSSFSVSLVLVLIGSKPKLDFLPSSLVSKLGYLSNAAIDIRQNSIKINPITHETVAAKNLYALGGLSGDQFVRFVQGGAVAVAAHLHHKKSAAEREPKDTQLAACQLV